MGGLVLMLHTALDWALYSGSYSWFNTLLEFMIRVNLGTIKDNQIYSLKSNIDTSQIATQVAITYGDFRRDKTLYKEASDAGMIAKLGMVKKLIPMHCGSPVITEDANKAEKLCSRILEYFGIPKETLEMTADLSAARFNLDDIIKVTSGFHGFNKADFYLTRRLYDKKKLRVLLNLMRDSS